MHVGPGLVCRPGSPVWWLAEQNVPEPFHNEATAIGTIIACQPGDVRRSARKFS
jgi:hypothetical protein